MTVERPTTDGILLLDKPEGLTSARVVAVAKRVLGGPKIGHLGTLDPFASGLLPLCVGEGTKLAPYLNEADKRYIGVLRLGVVTDTLDRTGQVIAEGPAPDVTPLALDELAREMVGDILQVPPAYSAIKRDGVPMYRLAREGRAPELDARPVRIHSLTLSPKAAGRVELEVHCSKGTYVRAIARDVGERLGCGATLESLVRTAFGRFSLRSALTLDALEEQGVVALRPPAFLEAADAVSHLPALAADEEIVRALRAGQQRALGTFGAPAAEAAAARVLDSRGRLIAILAAGDGRWSIGRVFV